MDCKPFHVSIPDQGIEEDCHAETPEEAAEEVAERVELDALLEPVVVSVTAPGCAPKHYNVRAFPIFVYEAEPLTELDPIVEAADPRRRDEA